MTITATKVEPRIWVGCLACYNDGRLVGEWIDPLDVDGLSTDETRKLIHKGTRERLCEEVWVMDHEGFGGLLKGECSPWEACELAKAIETIEARMPLAAFVAYRDNVGGDGDPLDLLDEAESAFDGEWYSTEDWAWDRLEDRLDALPEWVQSHRSAIVKSWLSDVEDGGMWTESAPGSGVYVFTS